MIKNEGAELKLRTFIALYSCITTKGERLRSPRPVINPDASCTYTVTSCEGPITEFQDLRNVVGKLHRGKIQLGGAGLAI